MDSKLGLFYGVSHRYIETDEGEGKRPISRDEWIKSLPVSWSTHVYSEREADIRRSISYFTALKTGFQKNCTRLERYADNHKTSTKLRFVSDINDEDYDSLIFGMEKNEPVQFQQKIKLEMLKRELDKLIDDCLKEKKLAVTICETIADIQRKPKEFPLKVWHLLSESSRNFIMDQESERQKEQRQQLPGGLLELIEVVRVQHDENIALKRDVEALCRKNMKIEMEKEHISENLSRHEELVQNNEARFRSKIEAHTRHLMDQITHVQRELEDQRRQNSFLQKKNITYETQVGQLRREKESLLTRLSQVAGSKLTMNNPAIADLSDKYRPMKLSEMFSGMYDDDWTDAVEELSSEGIEEKTVVVLLRDLVMTAFRLCKESHTIWIQMPECKLFARFDENNQVAKKTNHVYVELTEEEDVELRKCTNAFKRNHHKSFIQECQKRFIPLALEMIQNAKQPPTASDVYERPGFAKSNPESPIKDIDFTKAVYKKTALESQSENPSSPKKQKTLLFTSLEIAQSTGKETVCDRKTQSARADFARPSQQTDAQPNTNQNTDQHVSNELKQPNEANSESDKFSKVRKFAKRIVKLCWWMQSVQPPVHLDCSVPKDGKFNHELYKAYTKSGSQIDYIVWPVMFLHENGPLLSKGVAQPM